MVNSTVSPAISFNPPIRPGILKGTISTTSRRTIFNQRLARSSSTSAPTAPPEFLPSHSAKTQKARFRAFEVSDDGKKVLVRGEHDFKLYDAKPEGKTSPKTVSTANLLVDRVPQQEWTEIYNEVWRRYRDFFYAKNMHGYDWNALRQQYATLLSYVAHRSDLNYVLGKMVSELSTSHSYIEAGYFDLPKPASCALPRARLDRDHSARRSLIAN